MAVTMSSALAKKLFLLKLHFAAESARCS